jgi:hypothetical protein
MSFHVIKCHIFSAVYHVISCVIGLFRGLRPNGPCKTNLCNVRDAKDLIESIFGWIPTHADGVAIYLGYVSAARYMVAWPLHDIDPYNLQPWLPFPTGPGYHICKALIHFLPGAT